LAPQERFVVVISLIIIKATVFQILSGPPGGVSKFSDIFQFKLWLQGIKRCEEEKNLIGVNAGSISRIVEGSGRKLK